MKINRKHIERAGLFVRKWAMRLLVTAGAAATFVSCHTSKKAQVDEPTKPNKHINQPPPQPLVYGPPSQMMMPRDTLIRPPMPDPQEPVYGAPMPEPRLEKK